MSQILNIMVLVDPGTIPKDDPEFRHITQGTTTEYYVINALRSLGHNVSILGADDDIITIVKTVTELKPDLIFNLTEQLAGDRRMDMNIAAVLETTGIPYTGSGPAGLMLCRDKRLCKQLLSLYRIKVPRFVSMPQNRKIHIPKNLHYPLVVKPVFEDSSEGISNASLVNNEASLLERVQFVHERWEQAVIAEEYIEGREFYVGVLGNKQLTVLPIRECLFASNSIDGPQLATYRVKWNPEYRKKWNIKFRFAKLDATLLKNIQRVCKKVYRVLQIRDYGRIDLRLTANNKLVVLEVNPNPDIAYGEEVAEAAEKAGIPYKKLIDRILHLALRRYQ